jgi:hypothetical protein
MPVLPLLAASTSGKPRLCLLTSGRWSHLDFFSHESGSVTRCWNRWQSMRSPSESSWGLACSGRSGTPDGVGLHWGVFTGAEGGTNESLCLLPLLPIRYFLGIPLVHPPPHPKVIMIPGGSWLLLALVPQVQLLSDEPSFTQMTSNDLEELKDRV